MAIQITARVRLRDLGCEGDPPKKVTESRLELHDRIRGIVSEGSVGISSSRIRTCCLRSFIE